MNLKRNIKRTECPIWRTPATIEEYDHQRSWIYQSPRAGGAFMTSFPNDVWALELNLAQRAIVTTWILEVNRAGETAQIDNRLPQRLRRQPLPANLRADRLLQYIGSIEQSLGGWTTIFSSGTDPTSLLAAAWAECRSGDELSFLLASLAARRFIEWNPLPTANSLRLTLEGHARISDLAACGTDYSQAFVAMWFDKSMRNVYELGIEPAIVEAGFRPLRIDRKETISKVDDEIIAEIRRSRFLVADFTAEENKPRGGVYFEAGFAMGLNLPVIWACRSDRIAEVHFDTRQYSHIVWDSFEDLKLKLRSRIGAVIGWGPLQKPSPD